MKILEQHASEDLAKTATIFIPMKDCKTTNTRNSAVYKVVSKSDTGTHFTTEFDNVLDAQKFCEEWVDKND